ncbi:MAG: hypothetical protein HND52_11465 [Ignavibacteriae bacterium]|nr:hypothetical protein [Ignavibacteriota bacterium]NOG98567.1 hypothetical protein [Ignavibacteriota bacterium]
MAKKKSASRKKEQIKTIFDKVSKDDLKKFIEYVFTGNPEIKNSFIAYYAELIDESPDKKYNKLVKSIISSYENNFGFIDYRASANVDRELSNLLVKAEQKINDSIIDSIAICTTIIEEIPHLINYMDDSRGYITELYEAAFDILLMAVEKAPPQLKDKLFNYCIDEIQKEKYHDFDFDEGFFVIIPKLITLEEQEKIYFQIIDKLIEFEKRKDKSPFRINNLLKEKIYYLNKINRNEEAHKIIEANIDEFDFREILFNEELVNKNYNKAITIAIEGIQIAQKQSAPGHITNWQIKLLSIYETKGDVENIRKYAKQLFNSNRNEIKYYRIMKGTYKPDEWEKISESIIERIKSKDRYGGYDEADILAKIFIEENYKLRLLKLLEINSVKINFIDQYANNLKDDYPKEITAFYAEGIKKLAKITGRASYNEVSKYLIKLNEIEGGKEKVISLINYFRTTYKNRPAMMEILNKKFRVF